MSRIEHKSVSGVVTVQMVSSLIMHLEDQSQTNWNRTKAVTNQLYSTGVILNKISAALLRDIEAGDAILSERSPEQGSDQGNYTPETTAWLEWLGMYHLAQKVLRALEAAVAAIDLVGRRVDESGIAKALELLQKIETEQSVRMAA